MELGPEDVSLLERCPHFRGWYVKASMELGPEDVSLLERCPHFRGWYVQASMELGPEDVSLLERCPHFRSYLLSFGGCDFCRSSCFLGCHTGFRNLSSRFSIGKQLMKGTEVGEESDLIRLFHLCWLE